MKTLNIKNQSSYQLSNVPKLTQVPSLTTEDDQCYLYWLTFQMFEGKGKVLEIGTWFGSSASYLAAGLRDAQKSNEFYCIDRFQYSTTDRDKFIQQGFSVNGFVPGTDTSSSVGNYLKKIYPNTLLIKTDIANLTWNNGHIELIHLDAPKRWDDIVHVLDIIQPYLMPETSIIVAQDFCVPRAYALPLICGALKDSFKLVHIPSKHSTMAVFEYIKPYVVDEKLAINDWDISRVFETWEDITKPFYPQQKIALELGLAFYFYDNGNKEMAALILDKIKNSM